MDLCVYINKVKVPANATSEVLMTTMIKFGGSKFQSWCGNRNWETSHASLTKEDSRLKCLYDHNQSSKESWSLG